MCAKQGLEKIMLCSMAFRKLLCLLLGQIISYLTSSVTVRIVRADNELLHFISYCAYC
jgi:hypothetical protein